MVAGMFRMVPIGVNEIEGEFMPAGGNFQVQVEVGSLVVKGVGFPTVIPVGKDVLAGNGIVETSRVPFFVPFGSVDEHPRPA